MKNFIIALTVIVIVHYLFFLFGFSFIDGTNANFYMDNNLTLEKKGVFGDFTSGHFSILAFIWLAYGIYIQSKEFQLQREEFQNQTEQFKEQNKLYEQQMKELEIQSIQNQFDRKIAKLTDIEKDIASSNLTSYNIYHFITERKENIAVTRSFDKFDNIYKYLALYDNLNNFIKFNHQKIDLQDELVILKKDIYDGLKISFLIMLDSFQKEKITSHQLWYYKNKFEHLKIYKTIEENSTNKLKGLALISKITNRFQNLDDIDIFEEIEPS